MTEQIKIGNKMLNHYIKKHEYIPLWVLIRIMTLGEVAKICAHDEKLYDLKLNNAIMKNNIHFNYNLDLKDGKYSKGYKDLFSIIIILKTLLKDTEFKKFYTGLINDLEEIKGNIKSIDFMQILDKMGFPKNYEKLLNM